MRRLSLIIGTGSNHTRQSWKAARNLPDQRHCEQVLPFCFCNCQNFVGSVYSRLGSRFELNIKCEAVTLPSCYFGQIHSLGHHPEDSQRANSLRKRSQKQFGAWETAGKLLQITGKQSVRIQ